MTPEGEVLKACLALLHGIGIKAWRNSVGMKGGYTYGRKGSGTDVLHGKTRTAASRRWQNDLMPDFKKLF